MNEPTDLRFPVWVPHSHLFPSWAASYYPFLAYHPEHVPGRFIAVERMLFSWDVVEVDECGKGHPDSYPLLDLALRAVEGWTRRWDAEKALYVRRGDVR